MTPPARATFLRSVSVASQAGGSLLPGSIVETCLQKRASIKSTIVFGLSSNFAKVSAGRLQLSATSGGVNSAAPALLLATQMQCWVLVGLMSDAAERIMAVCDKLLPTWRRRPRCTSITHCHCDALAKEKHVLGTKEVCGNEQLRTMELGYRANRGAGLRSDMCARKFRKLACTSYA
ncbi:uncharacterized protein PITG_00515 [Phytophthora infestans T30-4]|uniref:Uncharacterized protein n=1 Tax=Phytophthora infestans (strain T30-4) TaxID=403677 RepID=D0MR04_PHYIT|nr:uncharacterized protein PITG_00515 [Phytophthora infestans T30-4]EEY57923.1 hypothetical protein PITG_00515 [Phytophthora infestans T30-4]|eukprot:XP_002909109.1 hypothetical protein PITG_00515 [Phytophthora infestans T30-4]